MKRFIVVSLLFVAVVGLLSACVAQKKCPAYGHHSYYETAPTVIKQL